MFLFLKNCFKLFRIMEGQIERGKQTIKKPKPRHVILNISIPKGVFLRKIWPSKSFWKVRCPQQLWELSPLRGSYHTGQNTVREVLLKNQCSQAAVLRQDQGSPSGGVSPTLPCWVMRTEVPTTTPQPVWSCLCLHA